MVVPTTSLRRGASPLRLPYTRPRSSAPPARAGRVARSLRSLALLSAGRVKSLLICDAESRSPVSSCQLPVVATSRSKINLVTGNWQLGTETGDYLFFVDSHPSRIDVCAALKVAPVDSNVTTSTVGSSASVDTGSDFRPVAVKLHRHRVAWLVSTNRRLPVRRGCRRPSRPLR